MRNRQWGQWRLEDDGLSLHLSDGTRELYWINLTNIRSSATMLDWIFQLTPKTWFTAQMAYDLLLAFEDIFDPQNNLCSWGIDKTLPKDFLKNGVSDGVEQRQPAPAVRSNH